MIGLGLQISGSSRREVALPAYAVTDNGEAVTDGGVQLLDTPPTPLQFAIYSAAGTVTPSITQISAGVYSISHSGSAPIGTWTVDQAAIDAGLPIKLTDQTISTAAGPIYTMSADAFWTAPIADPPVITKAWIKNGATTVGTGTSYNASGDSAALIELVVTAANGAGTIVNRVTAQTATVDPGGIPTVGMNLTSVSPNNFQPFMDLMKSSSGWFATGLSSSQMVTAGYVDIHGDLTNGSGFPSSVQCTFYNMDQIIASQSFMTGQYTMTWDGTCTVALPVGSTSGITNVVAVDANTKTFDMQGDAKYSNYFTVSGINWSDPPKNFKIIKTSNLSAYNAGAIFEPNWLDLHQESATLPKKWAYFRFMDWLCTNQNNTFMTWATRVLPTDQTWHPRRANLKITQTSTAMNKVAGVVEVGCPIEVIVALCNQTSTDCWYNIPMNADDTYIDGVATYLNANLNAGLKIYFEFSNEPWNVGFTNTDELRNQATNAWFGEDWVKAHEKSSTNPTGLYAIAILSGWHARQSARVMRRVRNIIADTDRARCLYTQNVGVSLTSIQQLMRGTYWQTYDPTEFAEYGGPTPWHTHWSCTGYFATSVHGDAGIYTNLQTSQAAAIAYVLPLMSASCDAIIAKLPNHASEAAIYGLKLITYEANQSFFAADGNDNLFVPNPTTGKPTSTLQPGVLELFTAVNYSVEVAAMNDRMRNALRANGFRGYSAFADFFVSNVNGTWGNRQFVGDTTPAWDALVAWNAANPKWW